MVVEVCSPHTRRPACVLCSGSFSEGAGLLIGGRGRQREMPEAGADADGGADDTAICRYLESLRGSEEEE